MLYVGIKELRLTEEKFWALTPRKFYSLLNSGMELQQMGQKKTKGKDDDAQDGFIDQIKGW
jgi:hypothetical protein